MLEAEDLVQLQPQTFERLVQLGGITLSALQKHLTKRAIERTQEILNETGRLSLSRFIREAWHVLEPTRIYEHGWHIDAMCEHLEAVTNGHLNRLLITIPPGTMKSLTTSVFWPAWEWGPQGLASNRIISFSYDMGVSVRDALKFRRLITSSFYQTLWGDRFSLLEDQNTKTRFDNSRTGFRLADYVGGGTGERGDRDIITLLLRKTVVLIRSTGRCCRRGAER